MDFQHRVGNKPNSYGLVSWAEAMTEQKIRLKRLQQEALDITKDPYILKNHIGTYECRLCLTIHNTEASYLAHTQGKKHQTNLQKRDTRDKELQLIPEPKIISKKKKTLKIGRP